MRDYLPFIQMDSSTHMHGFAVYVKERLPFARDLSLESSEKFLLMFSTGFVSLSFLLLFLYQSPSSSLCTVFDSISSNIDRVLSINPILVELIDLVNSVLIFLSQMTLYPDG